MLFDISVDGLLDGESKNTSHYTKIKKNVHENDFELNESICKKKKKKKQKQLTIKTPKSENVYLDDSHPEETDSQIVEGHKRVMKNAGKVKPKKGVNNSTSEDKGHTDDGFKIVSFIPDDDSDISDAFESCSDYENDIDEQDTRKETEDGFKIVTEIPPDDSDISDAFEDDDEDGFINTSLPCEQRGIKKPLMQIMDDFGEHWDFMEKNSCKLVRHAYMRGIERRHLRFSHL